MKNNTATLFLCLMISLGAVHSYAGLSVHTVTDNAFNGYINGVSFQQDAITTYNGYQYAVYWSSNQYLGIARRAVGDKQWETLELPDYRFATDNAHYDISMGISPRDGSIHLSFYQWSSVFNYRKSVTGLLDNPENFQWNSQLFGPVRNGLMGPTMQPTTYPRFVTTPSGKLLLLLRHGESGAGDSFLYEYDGHTGNWQSLGKLVDGLTTNINAYFNGMHYDKKDRLHATWVWRATPDATTNSDLHYIYSDDDGRSWLNNAGQLIARTGSMPIRQSTSGIRVWQIAQNRGLINQEAQAVDNDGRVSMLMSHMPDSVTSSSNFSENRLKARVYHYLRDLNGQWSRSLLPGSSFSYDRNKIAADMNNNLYAVINRDGIYRATPNGQWKDWQLVQSLTDQSLFAEVQLDRQRLSESQNLSILHINNKGQMLHLEYSDDGEPQAVSTTGGGPEGYTFCAFEGGTCQAPAGADIAYGASGQFVHRRSSGAITCNTDNFAEAIRGTVKRCYYATRQSNGNYPQGYSICADEGQTCQVTGTAHLAFGVDGAFHYRISSQDMACNTSNFGDPQRSVVKQCFKRDISTFSTGSSSASSSSSNSTTSTSSSGTSSTSSSGSDSEVSGGAIDMPSLLYFIVMGLAIVSGRKTRTG